MKALKQKKKWKKTHRHVSINWNSQEKQRKNVQMASNSQGGQQQNMKIIQVMSFIEELIQKLKILRERFKV